MTAVDSNRGTSDTDWPATPRWMADGACRTADPSILFVPSEDEEHGSAVYPGPALAVCARCPVISKCHRYALRYGPDTEFGVWGGTTPKMRGARVHVAPAAPTECGSSYRRGCRCEECVEARRAYRVGYKLRVAEEVAADRLGVYRHGLVG